VHLISEVIETLRGNRISSTQVCDVLGRSGSIPGILPISAGSYVAGPVHYVFANSGSNADLHEQIKDVPAGCIVFVDAIDCDGKAVFGDIVAKYLHLYKKALAVVTNGMIRDAHSLIRSGIPVWSAGRTPIGCINTPIPLNKEQEDYISAQRGLFEGSLMICDDTGVALIGSSRVEPGLLRGLEAIELQEDIWYFCIDTLKWSTYDTIVLKRYLHDPSVLPANLRDRLSDLESL
jgi:4-hydroxy-4-methyl-2-oxoglutarate aldolase